MPDASDNATSAAVAELETEYDAREYAAVDDHPVTIPMVASPGGANALHHP